jgi:hypothetical protein
MNADQDEDSSSDVFLLQIRFYLRKSAANFF